MSRNDARILFVGIYDYGLAALDALCRRGFDIAAVVSKPEPPGGTQPVAARARQKGLPLLLPDSPNSSEFIRQAGRLRPDLIVVAGYHKRFPQALLNIPPLGVINLHASLLPAYRGPCPWKWALINGESRTGVTVHDMIAELDRGDILAQRAFAIDESDTADSLFHKFCTHGPQLLVETLERMGDGLIERMPQDESLASYFSYPTERDGRISWRQTAEKIRNLVRGLHPSPGAWTQWRGQRLTIGAAEPLAGKCAASVPGQVVHWDHNGIVVGTAGDDVKIRQLRLGSNPVSIGAAVAELGIRRGDCFDLPQTSE